jgi:hypothetical protein
MSNETYKLLKRNLLVVDATREELQEALDAAENLGYYDGEWSDQPACLIAFVDGFLSGK